MLILTGNNLGERHRDFNAKVSEAADKKIDFEEIKSNEDKCDVDKLYKIDLASRYRKVDYILEVLKCGNAFYVTRALKCLWLYSDEYSDFINPNYIINNLFPHMSIKMQRKMLTTVSVNLKNGERAVDFYKYCKEAKLNDYAYKFLVLTSDDFKLKLMKDGDKLVSRTCSNFLEKFIGSSFEIALAYISLHNYSEHIIYLLRFMYSVSDEWYLDILEKYGQNNLEHPNSLSRLGIRVSRDILKKHRNRVFKSPKLYINKLNKSMLLKYLSPEDIKTLAYALLPTSTDYYWSTNFYGSYKFILDKIPTNELLGFMKKIFNSKFEGKPFEIAIDFYKLKYYEMLSIEEREKWALDHIERDEELPGIESYIWYKFVSFKNAFIGIKRYIFLTPDEDKRSQIVNILPETARNQDDLKNVIDYYYQRHVNESEENKERFINKVIEHHDIYSFDNECWTSLDKLFYSLEVYTSTRREEYKARSLIYHILHKIELLESLKELLKYCHVYSIQSLIKELSAERNYIVAHFFMDYYAEIILELIETPREDSNDEENKDFLSDPINVEIIDYINKVWNVIYCFKREHDECPDIVVQFMNSHMDYFQYHEQYKIKFIKRSEEDFVRWLKQDVQLAVDGINEIRCNTYRYSFRLCRLFRKLKVYFPDDVGKEYLDYFVEYLSDIPKTRREYRNIKMAVVGVFYLADEEFKVTFMGENAPVTPKIDHRNIDNRVLQVQKAICRLAYHAQLPLASVHKYITGDYVHYILPIFNNYLTNLVSISNIVEIILDAPLSIQKHGLRLAFRSYSPENLKPIITNAWKNTENVSLRKMLYKLLFKRILNESNEGQKELYETLKWYTSELNHDDDNDVYSLLVSDDLPDEFKGDFIETSWNTVSVLSDKSIDMERRLSIINHMEKYIHFVEREFPRVQIIDDHVNEIFRVRKNKKRAKVKDYSYFEEEIIKAKWSLTAKYIVSCNNAEELQRSLQLMTFIMNNIIAQWDYEHRDSYVSRKFIRSFISKIVSKEPKISKRSALIVPIYQCILDTFTSMLKEEEIYLITWDLKLTILSRNIIQEGVKDEAQSTNEVVSKKIINEFGKKVGRMVKKQVEKNEFQHCFYDSLADILMNAGNTICDFMSVNSTYCNYYMTDSLIDTKITETHVLALLILPSDPPPDWDKQHSNVINTIKQFDSKQIRSFLYKKYVQSDYRERMYYKI